MAQSAAKRQKFAHDSVINSQVLDYKYGPGKVPVNTLPQVVPVEELKFWKEGLAKWSQLLNKEAIRSNREPSFDRDVQSDRSRIMLPQGLIRLCKKDRKRQRPKTLPNYNPFKDPHIEGEPEKTLFVARIDYKTTEESLKNAFEKYGTIENLHLVRDVNSGQSKGYAFIVYKHSSEQRKAYKEAHRMMLDGRQVLVDKERSRIEMNWKPRRLGGGKKKRHSTL